MVCLFVRIPQLDHFLSASSIIVCLLWATSHVFQSPFPFLNWAFSVCVRHTAHIACAHLTQHNTHLYSGANRICSTWCQQLVNWLAVLLYGYETQQQRVAQPTLAATKLLVSFCYFFSSPSGAVMWMFKCKMYHFQYWRWMFLSCRRSQFGCACGSAFSLNK